MYSIPTGEHGKVSGNGKEAEKEHRGSYPRGLYQQYLYRGAMEKLMMVLL
jgi:hypothetical protein